MEVFGVVTAWVSNGKGAMVLGIPKDLRERLQVEQGRKFVVGMDAKGRIVYTPKA
jgi:antitoxin component of MazEF toxin-antitoxin module